MAAGKIILNAFLKAMGSKSTKPKVDVFKLSSEIKKAADKKKAAAAKVAKNPKAHEDKLVAREHKPKGPKTAPKIRDASPPEAPAAAPMLALPAPAPEPPKLDPKTQRHPEHEIGVGMLKSLGFKHEVANTSITKATQAIGADQPLGDVIKHALKSNASA